MDRRGQPEIAFPDESTLRVWEDMRSEVLHELQEGAQIPDSVMDSIAQLAANIMAWRSTTGSALLESSSRPRPG